MRSAIAAPILITALLALAVTAQDPIGVVMERAADAAALDRSHAAALLDSGRVTVSPDGSRHWVIHEQILLRHATAFEAYGVRTIPFNRESQTASITYARTILPSGEVVAVDASRIRVIPLIAGNSARSGSLMALEVSFPDLATGAIVDYEAVVVDQRPPFGGEFFDVWILGWEIPVLYTKYVLDVPQSFDVTWTASGRPVEPVVQTTSERTRLTFADERIPALHTEIAMPSRYAVSSRIVSSSLSSWDECATLWWELAAPATRPDPAVAARACDLCAGATTDAERISLLFDYAAAEIEYVPLRYVEPQPAAATMSSRVGDCKDQSVLLIALLEAVGIEAHLVLVDAGTRYGLDWSEPPSLAAFDHAIVGVPMPDGEWQLLDPTCDVCTADYTLSALRGRRWLLASDDPARFGTYVETARPRAIESATRCVVDATLSAELDLWRGDATVQLSGDDALIFRGILQRVAEENRGTFFTMLGDSTARALDHALVGADDPHLPLSYTVRTEMSTYFRKTASGVLRFSLPYGPTLEPPPSLLRTAGLPQRVYPLDTRVRREEHILRVAIGNRSVSRLPDDIRVENAVGSFRASYSVHNGTILCVRVLEIDVPQVAPAEYPLYVELALAVRDDESARIVLRD